MNKSIWLQIGISGPRGNKMKRLWGHEVKAQGHTTQKLDLEIWQRRRSRPLRSSRSTSSVE